MSAQNFIGSKISLISVSDIRYVGTLHSLNTQESSVALEKVRSYGTEGRRGKPEEEVPPSDSVFDYVVFRGSDIKDLQVIEPPAKPAMAPPPPPMPHDPAIMSMRQPVGMDPYMAYPPGYWHPSAAMQAQAMHPPPPMPPHSLPSTQHNLPKPYGQTTDAMHPSAHQPMPPTARAPNAQPAPPKEQPKDSKNDDVVHLAQALEGIQLPKERTQDDSQTRRRPAAHAHSNGGNRGGRQHNHTHTHVHRQRVAEVVEFAIPKSDFDFEKANSLFDKQALVEEGELKKMAEVPEDEHVHIPAVDEDEVYNKNKSFFDNISCEANDRLKQSSVDRKSKINHERQINIETFGETMVERPRFRMRGRGGFRGRGRGHGQFRGNSRHQFADQS